MRRAPLAKASEGSSGSAEAEDAPDSPVFFKGKSDLRCTVEGSSFMRSDSCRLKGDVFWLSAGKPLKEPCLAITSAGACLRGITWGPRVAMEGGGEEVGGVELPVWGPAELVPLLDVFPLTLSSASAGEKTPQLSTPTSGLTAQLLKLTHFQTLFSILQLSHHFLPLCRLCCCGNTKGAFPGKSGPVGIKGCRDATLLLPFLFALQTGSEGTAHSVAEPLSLQAQQSSSLPIEQQQHQKR